MALAQHGTRVTLTLNLPVSPCGQPDSPSEIMGPAIVHGMRPSLRSLVASHGHSLKGALQDGRGHVLLRATRHNRHRRRRSNLPVVTHSLDFRCGLCGEGR